MRSMLSALLTARTPSGWVGRFVVFVMVSTSSTYRLISPEIHRTLKLWKLPSPVPPDDCEMVEPSAVPSSHEPAFRSTWIKWAVAVVKTLEVLAPIPSVV